MFKIFKSRIMLIWLLIIFVLSFAMPIEAGHAENVGYSVRAMIPENQIDKNQTYFDLLMKPKQKQVINVEILNNRNEGMEINAHITNPQTNRNGLIDYTNTQTKVDESLKVPITEIAAIEKTTVKVPAKGSRIVPIRLKMPEEEFDGMILGGIFFENHSDEGSAPQQQITNKYAYVIGLKLSETDVKVKPELHLRSVKPGLVNYHTAVIANIQNSAPVIVDTLTLNARVYNSKDKEIHKADVKDYRMAPNSTMPFAIDWQNQKLKPGTYTLKLHAETGKQKWNWEKEFIIPSKAARGLNNKAVEITKDYTWYVIIGLCLIILILIFIIIRLMRKNKQQSM